MDDSVEEGRGEKRDVEQDHQEKENNISKREEIKAIRYTVRRAERIIDHQVDWFMQTEEDVSTFLRYNILILGGFVSVFTYGIQLNILSISTLLNIYVYQSLIFWFASTTSVVISYGFLWMELGIEDVFHSESHFDEVGELADTDSNPDRFVDTRFGDLYEDKEVIEEEYYREILGSYIGAIHTNELEANRFRFPLNYLSVLLMLDAVLVFAVGVFIGLREIGAFEIESIILGIIPVTIGWMLFAGVLIKINQYRGRIWSFIVGFIK